MGQDAEVGSKWCFWQKAMVSVVLLSVCPRWKRLSAVGLPVHLWGLSAGAGAGVLSCSTSSSDEDDDDDKKRSTKTSKVSSFESPISRC